VSPGRRSIRSRTWGTWKRSTARSTACDRGLHPRVLHSHAALQCLRRSPRRARRDYERRRHKTTA
jgi:hypothetical protein